MDFSAFGKDDFQSKEWINTALIHLLEESDEAPETFFAVMIMKLQLLAQELRRSTEAASLRAVGNMPRAFLDVEKLQRESGSLQNKLDTVMGKLEQLEESSPEAVDVLAATDRFKNRMASSSQLLSRVSRISALQKDTDQILSSGNPHLIVNHLSEARATMDSLQAIPEFSVLRKEFDVLCDGIADDVQKHLKQAITDRDSGTFRRHAAVLDQLGRLESAFVGYVSEAKGPFVALPTGSAPLPPKGAAGALKDVAADLIVFYDQFLLNFEKEKAWLVKAFDIDVADDTTASHNAALMHAAKALAGLGETALGELFQTIHSHIEGIISAKTDQESLGETPLDALPRLARVVALYEHTHSFAERVRAMIAHPNPEATSETPTMLLDEGRMVLSIYQPFFPFQRRFASLLLNDLSDRRESGADASGSTLASLLWPPSSESVGSASLHLVEAASTARSPEQEKQQITTVARQLLLTYSLRDDGDAAGADTARASMLDINRVTAKEMQRLTQGFAGALDACLRVTGGAAAVSLLDGIDGMLDDRCRALVDTLNVLGEMFKPSRQKSPAPARPPQPVADAQGALQTPAEVPAQQPTHSDLTINWSLMLEHAVQFSQTTYSVARQFVALDQTIYEGLVGSKAELAASCDLVNESCSEATQKGASAPVSTSRAAAIDEPPSPAVFSQIHPGLLHLLSDSDAHQHSQSTRPARPPAKDLSLDRYHQTCRLLETLKSPDSAHPTTDPPMIVKRGCRAALELHIAAEHLVLHAMLEPIRRIFGEMPSSDEWTKLPTESQYENVDLPSFSLSPSSCVTRVGEYLFTLPQTLEPFESESYLVDGFVLEAGVHSLDSEDVTAWCQRQPIRGDHGPSLMAEAFEQHEGFAATWLALVSYKAELELMAAIGSIDALSETGGRQLLVDIEYFLNVLTALGMPHLLGLVQIIELLRADNGEMFWVQFEQLATAAAGGDQEAPAMRIGRPLTQQFAKALAQQRGFC